MRKVLVLIVLVSLSLTLAAPSCKLKGMEFFIAYIRDFESEREFKLFADNLAYIESRDKDNAVNPIGAIGLYQFMPSTLRHLGYHDVTVEAFKADPGIFDRDEQYNALKQLVSLNKEYLKPYHHYLDDTIKGIHITKAGLLAGMHLGGIGSVKLFLLSDGKIDKSDSNGTKISDYIETFGKYKL